MDGFNFENEVSVKKDYTKLKKISLLENPFFPTANATDQGSYGCSLYTLHLTVTVPLYSKVLLIFWLVGVYEASSKNHNYFKVSPLNVKPTLRKQGFVPHWTLKLFHFQN